MKRILLPLLLLLPCGCALEEPFLFDPVQTDHYDLPGNTVPASQLEELTFTSADGTTLYGMLALQAQPLNTASVLHLHGQGTNIDTEWARDLPLWEAGYNLLLVDYRGYGKSEGVATEQGLYQDAAAALAALRARASIDPDRIIVHGHSMGCAIAIETAISGDPELLFLEAPFTSLGAMIENAGTLTPDADWLTGVEMNNVARIPNVAVPILVVHGRADQRIPFWMGEEVYAAAPDPKAFLAVPGADHRDSLGMATTEIVSAMTTLNSTVAPGVAN